MTVESLHAGRFVHEALADTGLPRYPDVAPSGTPTPFIAYSYSGGADIVYTNRVRALVRQVWRVWVTGEGGSYGPLKSHADAIDQALHRAVNVPVEGVMMVSCERMSIIQLSEVSGSVTYKHLGGEYLILTSP